MTSAYDFRAVDRDGQAIGGTTNGASADVARAALNARGLFVLSLKARSSASDLRRSIPSADLALGFRILADLLDAGLPVARALQSLESLAPRGWREALPEVLRMVREGRSLASALTAASVEIPPLLVGIIQAGEAGSGVAPAVRRAADLAESSAEMRASIRAALAYPMIVAIAGALAVTILVTVVLPRFARILADLDQQLPPSTQLVLELANAAHRLWLPGSITILLTAAAWMRWVRTPAGRRRWDELLLAIPGLGTLRFRRATARWAYALAALLESGVPMSTALGFAARASGDTAVSARLAGARDRVTAGEALSWAVEATRAGGSTVIRLARAGEESGRLSAMLAHAARIEQDGADRVVRTVIRLIEPLLLLVFATVVALVAAALLQAIYSVRPV